MQPSAPRTTDFALGVGLSMTVWIVLYQINTWWFSALDWADGVSWIFLPAAVRLLAVLLFGASGALGLFAGGVFTMSVVEAATWTKALSIAATSSLAPLLAVGLMLRRWRLPSSLCGLSTRRLVLLAVASAATSVILHNLFYWLSDMRSDPLSGLLPMFVGDIAGTVIVLYLARTALRLRMGGPHR